MQTITITVKEYRDIVKMMLDFKHNSEDLKEMLEFADLDMAQMKEENVELREQIRELEMQK